MSIPIQIRDNIIEEKMKYAHASQNPLKYANFCEELGIEPEDTALYERGLAERKFLEHSQYKKERANSDFKYEEFYKTGQYLNSSFSKDVNEKRNLLQKFFKGKRKRNLEEINNLKLGALFSNILEYSKNRLSKQ